MPGKQFFPRRAEGKVYSAWIPGARVNVETADKFLLEWSFKMVADLHVEKQAVEAELRVVRHGGGEVQSG
jgi:hypothetical protein